jgi:hypothetical protein
MPGTAVREDGQYQKVIFKPNCITRPSLAELMAPKSAGPIVK